MPRILPLLMILLAVSTAAAPRPAGASGPLQVENSYPPILPFLVVPAEAPAGGEAGRLTLGCAATYGNVFHWDPGVMSDDLTIRIDGEVLRLAFRAGYGLSSRLSVGAAFSLLGMYGGFLDPLIQGIHGFFGLPNGDRAKSADNLFGFSVVRSGVAMVDLDRPFWAPGDLVVSARWTLLAAEGDGAAAALQAALKVPVGAAGRFASSGAPDASIGILASYRKAPFAAYGGLRYLYLGPPVWPAVLGFRPHNLAFFTGLEWAPSRRVAWLAQADGASLPYRYPHPWFGAWSGTVSAGARVRLAPGLLLQVHVSEEFLSFASLDISAGAAATLTFGPPRVQRRPPGIRPSEGPPEPVHLGVGQERHLP
jgi:hypothetical protein